MTRNIYPTIRRVMLAASMPLLAWSCNDDFQDPAAYPGGLVTLTAECGDMLPQFIDPTDVQSRAGDAKDKEEKEINTLHVFFFDSKTDGTGKHPLLSPGTVEFKPYQCLTTNILAVPELEKIFDQGTDEIIVCALANLSGKNDAGVIADPTALRFATPYSHDEENVVFIKGTHRADGIDSEPEVYEITCLEDLRDWVYCPVLRSEEKTTIDKLPKAGMPMVGERTITRTDYGGTTGTNLKIPMKALMARIDLRIKLDPDNVNSSLGLPKMTITGYGVKNMPKRVPFTPRTGGGYDANPADTTNQPLEIELVKDEMNTITKDQEVRFRYYTYENVRQPFWEAKRTDESPAYNLSVNPPVVNYPKGVTKDEQKQRWKPTIARKWSASAIIIKGQYITHQNLTYNAQFTIYIGDNTVDDFKVCRNRQYVNNITIKGLDYVRNSDDGVYTFDGRVNVVSDNPIYISVVNERKVDAHASVLPMDFFFMRTYNPATEPEPNSEVEISLSDPNNPGNTPDWIRLEKIPGEAMRTGSYRSDGEGFIQGMPGMEYAPGTGARKYFAHNLVSDTLAAATHTTISRRNDGSRTRVYFYIDENVPTVKQPSGQNWPDRMATVYVTYRLRDEAGNVIEERPRTIEIEQRGLLRVESNANERDMDFYIEYYEEYMAHNDPLDMHDIPGQVYDGLQWCKPSGDFNNGSVSFETNGSRGTTPWSTGSGYRGWLQSKNYVSWNDLGLGTRIDTRYRSYNIYGERDGYWMTDYMVNGREGRRPIDLVKTYNRTLDEQPPTAFHYCYGKNKRVSVTDGNVYQTGKTGYWYMPGITELEQAMEKYYQQFPEFHDNLYWSASSAKSDTNSEDINCARATNIDDNGNHIASGYEQPVGTPENLTTGRRPRNFSHRIRATYIVL